MPSFPASIKLASLDGTNGFRLDGKNADDFSGRSVSSAGDVNGDGYGDVIVGAYGADPDEITGAGESYVVFGKQAGWSASVDLASLDGSTGFRLDGMDVYDNSGLSVSSAGDVNGDGYDDVIVGAHGAGGNVGKWGAGESYVVFGKQAGWSASVDLATLDGTTGFRLDGKSAGDDSGSSVSSAGDVNGDGYDDVIVGARRADPDGIVGAGESYVVFGKQGGWSASIDLASLDGSTGFRLEGKSEGDDSGFSVSSAGDVNGDGYDDVIVGARYADADRNFDAGASYVVFGKQAGWSASIDLDGLDGTTGFRLDGEFIEDYSGWSVSSAGDVNGDGYDDVIVGARYASSTDAGASYVVFGKQTGWSASLDLTSLDGSTGFRLTGNIYDQSGFVSSAGDVNGDGYDDIIVGANSADPDGIFTGASYVVFGKQAGWSASIDLASLDGTTGFRLDGRNAGDNSGFSVSSAGDVNGDGYDDVIIGASSADADGKTDAGESYVVFGQGPNRAPTAAFTASPSPAAPGQTIILDASTSSDPDSDTLSYAWDLDNDGQYDDATGVSISYSFPTSGSHTVGLQVTDSFGASSTDTSILLIDGTVPTLAISVSDASPDDGEFKLGETLTLSFNFSEEVTGFSNADIVLSGGTLVANSFEQDSTDPTLYTLQATFTRPGSVAVADNAYADLGGRLGTGDSLAFAVVGTPRPDTIIGSADPDTLDGRDGNDVLVGHAGDDILIGGRGNDTFFVDSADDTVIEIAGSGQGTADVVRTSVSYRLGTEARVELLTTTNATDDLTLTGNDFANAIHGNAGANILNGLGGVDNLRGEAGEDALYGGIGNDTLNGGADADRMAGGAGSDVYLVDNRLDRVIEAAGEGSDRVRAETSYALHANQAIERLETTDAAGTNAIGLTGNNLSQFIFGNDGDNVLNGGSGGTDTLTGRAGQDSFVFASAPLAGTFDRITDFSHADDVIHLNDAVFSALATGVLTGSAFKNLSSGQVDADDRILYNPTTGALSYDADGRGGVAAERFAVLGNKPADLGADDFLVV